LEEANRIIAIDPGDKRIGVALSDPTGTIASPLSVIKHISLQVDAAHIVQLAEENHARLIVVGQALGSDGEETPSSRHAQKLADALRSQGQIPVVLWDESGSTRLAQQARLEMGTNREHRVGHLDELAAVVILQDYLEERE